MSRQDTGRLRQILAIARARSLVAQMALRDRLNAQWAAERTCREMADQQSNLAQTTPCSGGEAQFVEATRLWLSGVDRRARLELIDIEAALCGARANCRRALGAEQTMEAELDRKAQLRR